MSDLFGNWADFNGDGEVDNLEKFVAMEIVLADEESGTDDEEETELELAGLDPDELSWMDAGERRKVLEDAGLDPDEFDF